MRGVEIECHQRVRASGQERAGANFACPAGRDASAASRRDDRRYVQKARVLKRPLQCAFLPIHRQIFANECVKFGRVTVSDKMYAFLKAQPGELRRERSKQERAGGEHFEDAQVGVLRKIVAADIHDDL